MPENQKACDGLVFIETRKRKPGREYKTNTDVMNYRIVSNVFFNKSPGSILYLPNTFLILYETDVEYFVGNN